MDRFSKAFDWLFDFLADCLQWIVDLLPDSPFKMLDYEAIKPYLGYVNWVIPINFMVTTLGLWLTAVAGYYCWSVVLRWLKAID